LKLERQLHRSRTANLIERVEAAVSTTGAQARFRGLAVTTFSVKQGLSNAAVVSVLASGDGSVWFGTESAMNRRNNGQITTYDKREAKLNGLAPNSLFQAGEFGSPLLAASATSRMTGLFP
jgi:hypothetical protein